jgi:hypothetical protein
MGIMLVAGLVRQIILDPFWAGRRADEFDQNCR